MAQRYQDGHLRRAKRKRGPDVWEFLWRERGPDGKRRQRTLTVGNLEELRTEREVLNRGNKYLHDIKAVAVEHWLRNLSELSNGSKCKIRNIMSGIFSHAIRYEFADKNPITAVRQSGKRRKVPVLLEPSELL